MITSIPLESCRTSFDVPDRRHLRPLHGDRALCGCAAPYGAGAGTWESLLRWPTCVRCRRIAERMGPHASQDGRRPFRLDLPDEEPGRATS